MYEVEVKVRADHAAVRSRLEALGAEPLGTDTEVDTYYAHPARDFADTDEALRIREVPDGSGARLTYKGPLVDAASKTRREVETRVADAEAIGAILEAVGFDPVATVRKTRERFAMDGFEVCLDDVDGLGAFVEVETEAAEDDIDAERDRAHDLLRRLELDPDEQIRRSYLELRLEGGDAPR